MKIRKVIMGILIIVLLSIVYFLTNQSNADDRTEIIEKDEEIKKEEIKKEDTVESMVEYGDMEDNQITDNNSLEGTINDGNSGSGTEELSQAEQEAFEAEQNTGVGADKVLESGMTLGEAKLIYEEHLKLLDSTEVNEEDLENYKNELAMELGTTVVEIESMQPASETVTNDSQNEAGQQVEQGNQGNSNGEVYTGGNTNGGDAGGGNTGGNTESTGGNTSGGGIPAQFDKNGNGILDSAEQFGDGSIDGWGTESDPNFNLNMN